MHTESSITAGSMMEAWLPVSSIRGDVKTTQSDRRSANPRVSIVVPALNEARNLEIILPRLPKVHEVIVVDGDSTDDSEAVVRAILPEAKFVRQTRRGKGNALAVGFAAVTGDIVVMFDADGSADPAEISRYVDALLAGADFARDPVTSLAEAARTSRPCAVSATRVSAGRPICCSARGIRTCATDTTPSGWTSCHSYSCPRSPFSNRSGGTGSKSKRLSTPG